MGLSVNHIFANSSGKNAILRTLKFKNQGFLLLQASGRQDICNDNNLVRVALYFSLTATIFLTLGYTYGTKTIKIVYFSI